MNCFKHFSSLASTYGWKWILPLLLCIYIYIAAHVPCPQGSGTLLRSCFCGLSLISKYFLFSSCSYKYITYQIYTTLHTTTYQIISKWWLNEIFVLNLLTTQVDTHSSQLRLWHSKLMRASLKIQAGPSIRGGVLGFYQTNSRHVVYININIFQYSYIFCFQFKIYSSPMRPRLYALKMLRPFPEKKSTASKSSINKWAPTRPQTSNAPSPNTSH